MNRTAWLQDRRMQKFSGCVEPLGARRVDCCPAPPAPRRPQHHIIGRPDRPSSIVAANGFREKGNCDVGLHHRRLRRPGAAQYGFGAPTFPLDLRGPRSGCWPHDGEVAGGAVADSTLSVRGDRWSSGDRSCGRRGAGRAPRATGSSPTRGIERSAP